jgi:hypothetical protein
MIGWNIRQLLGALPRLSPTISSVTMTSYVPAPILAERLTKASALPLAPILFVREALKHRGYASPIEEYSTESLAGDFSASPQDGTVRGFCSRVHLRDGTEAQLPLLDFQCSVSDENTAALVEAATLMGQMRGALVASGRSYHYYGFDPLMEIEWRKFMARCVLLAPLIDARYLAHCMIENLACLRIDPRPNQSIEPIVVRVLG